LSYALGLLLGLFSIQGITPASAKQSADFLKAEGAPVKVAKALEKGLRKVLREQGQYKLLPNPMAPGMVQLTMGCTLDAAACVKGLAKMRKAKIIFHLRVLPFGSRAKVIFRKLDGATGKALKVVSYRFRRRKIKKALRVVSQKMFGSKPVVKRIPPVIARRRVPKRRAPARRVVAVVTRRIPPRRADVRPPVRRPTKRRIVAPRIAIRTTPPRTVPIKRVLPPTRRIVIKRITPPKRRKVAVRKRTAPKPRPKPTTPLIERPSFWAWVCVGITVASTGGLLAFGLDASSKQSDVQELINRSKQGKDISYKLDVEPLEKQGQTSATLANVFLGVAVAAMGTATILFLLPPKSKTKTAQLLPAAKATTANGTLLFKSNL
jgi:hypothetical protein